VQSRACNVRPILRRPAEQSFFNLIQNHLPLDASNDSAASDLSPAISYANLYPFYLYRATPSFPGGNGVSFALPVALTRPAISPCVGHRLTQKRNEPPKADHSHLFQDQSVCKNECKSDQKITIPRSFPFLGKINRFMNKINHLTMNWISICMCQNECIPTLTRKATIATWQKHTCNCRKYFFPRVLGRGASAQGWFNRVL
jgi:hypothetical protein